MDATVALHNFQWTFAVVVYCDDFLRNAAFLIEEIEFNTVTEPMFDGGPNWTRATISSVTFKDRIVQVDF